MLRRPTAPPGPAPLRAAIVFTRTGNSYRGALVACDGLALVLRHASMSVLDQGAQAARWQGLDGDVWIPTSNVEFWQDALPEGVLT